MTTENKQLPKRWTEDEEKELLKLVKKGKSAEEIGEELGRSSGGPQIRLSQIAVRMITEGKSKAEVMKTTKISEEALDKQLKFQKKREDKVKNAPTMEKLEAKLDLILKKLDEKN